MSTCELAHSDAAYVLGALSPADREAFAAHLPGCEVCTRSVQELAGVPGLLAQVDPADLAAHTEPPPPAPPLLLARVVRSARWEQRRRTWRVAGAAAAAALVIGAGGAWTVGGVGDRPVATATPTSTAAALSMRQVGQDVVTATVAAVPVAWGTRIDLRCTWAGARVDSGSDWGSSDGPGPAYSLVVRTADGRTEQVATWRALLGRTMQLSGATATPLADIAAIEVRTASGRVVLETKA